MLYPFWEIDWYGAAWKVNHQHTSEVPTTRGWMHALAVCRAWDSRDWYEL